MDHATDKEGKAEHFGEQFFTFIVFAVLALGLLATSIIQSESNAGQFDRLEAIEFRLDCPEHRQALDVDDELVCLVEEDES